MAQILTGPCWGSPFADVLGKPCTIWDPLAHIYVEHSMSCKELNNSIGNDLWVRRFLAPLFFLWHLRFHPNYYLPCCSGNLRLNRLYAAAQREDPSPPLDLRYIKRPQDKSCSEPSQARADILSFLNTLYESLAETLPDSKDETFDDIDATQMSQQALTDSYAILLNRTAGKSSEAPEIPDPVGVKPPKTKKVRTVTKGVKLNLDRVGGEDSGQEEIRWLPPGSIKDTWEQYRQTSALDRPAAFPTFWRVSWFLPDWCFHFSFSPEGLASLELIYSSWFESLNQETLLQGLVIRL